MNKIDRTLKEKIIIASNSFNAIALIGPRQSGKTTLARMLFPDYTYYNLENPDTRLIALEDPRAILNSSEKLILDEIQKAPLLLSYLQQYLDESKLKVILTGSNQLDLSSKISQSLAGRTAIFKLLPLSIAELKSAGIDLTIDEYLFKGFYPAIHDMNQNPTLAYRSYYETYLQKDVRQVTNINNIHFFDKFLRLCAGRIGNLVNYSTYSNELGVSVNTIKGWLSILESSFICYTLNPYFANLGKRMIKSPKLYFYDVGLATYLLGIEEIYQIERDPLRGALYENLVVNEFIKERFNSGKEANGYFYRDSNHLEVDYIVNNREGIDLYEIKSASTYQPSFSKNINHFSNIEGINIKSKNIIYNGESLTGPNGLSILNFKTLFGN